MVENTGNKYRTTQAITAGLVLIAAAAAILVWGLTDLGIGAVVGIFLAVVGVAVAVMSLMHSAEPDKFGPSEKVYRLVFGFVLILVGMVGILSAFDLGWYVYAAVLLIGIALIGICTAVSNSNKTKY